MFGWLGVPMDGRVYTGAGHLQLCRRIGAAAAQRVLCCCPLLHLRSRSSEGSRGQLAYRRLVSGVCHVPSPRRLDRTSGRRLRPGYGPRPRCSHAAPCTSSPGAGYTLALCAVCILLSVLVYAWYNLQFVQHQGRYLFTALIPLAVVLALGWDEALRRERSRALAGALALLAVALLAWGVLVSHGLPKWPVALALLAAAAFAVRPWLPRSWMDCSLPCPTPPCPSLRCMVSLARSSLNWPGRWAAEGSRYAINQESNRRRRRSTAQGAFTRYVSISVGA